MPGKISSNGVLRPVELFGGKDENFFPKIFILKFFKHIEKFKK